MTVNTLRHCLLQACCIVIHPSFHFISLHIFYEDCRKVTYILVKAALLRGVLVPGKVAKKIKATEEISKFKN